MWPDIEHMWHLYNNNIYNCFFNAWFLSIAIYSNIALWWQHMCDMSICTIFLTCLLFIAWFKQLSIFGLLIKLYKINYSYTIFVKMIVFELFIIVLFCSIFWNCYIIKNNCCVNRLCHHKPLIQVWLNWLILNSNLVSKNNYTF